MYNKNRYPHEYAYLDLLNQIAENNNGYSGLYGLEQMRIDLHKEIFRNLVYKIDIDDFEVYLRTKEIFNHLDKVINFNPPEQIGISAYQLNRLLNCAECRYFLEGKSNLLRTEYGYTIEIK